MMLAMARRRNLNQTRSGSIQGLHGQEVKRLPGRVFALRGGTQHGNVGHNNHVVFGTHREIFAERVDLAQVVAQRAIVILYDVYLFPGLAADEVWNLD